MNCRLNETLQLTGYICATNEKQKRARASTADILSTAHMEYVMQCHVLDCTQQHEISTQLCQAFGLLYGPLLYTNAPYCKKSWPVTSINCTASGRDALLICKIFYVIVCTILFCILMLHKDYIYVSAVLHWYTSSIHYWNARINWYYTHYSYVLE